MFYCEEFYAKNKPMKNMLNIVFVKVTTSELIVSGNFEET